MDRIWWQLPGPGRFVETLVSQLLKGINLVVTTPAPLPDGLRGAVFESLERYRHSFHPLDYREADRDPLSWLGEKMSLDSVHSLRELAVHRNFMAQTTWVEGVDATSWPAWRRLLEPYAQQSRDRQEHERGAFCLLLPCPQVPLSEDLLLKRKLWDKEQVRTLDMSLYVALHIGDDATNPDRHLLRQELIAGLAGCNPELALELMDFSLAELLDISRLKGHCPALAGYADQDLDRRLWRAQVRCLFPLLEEHRLRLLSRWERKLSTAYERFRDELNTVAERPDHFMALGLGEIGYLLVKHVKVDTAWRNYLEQLRRIRNHLAHQQPVPEALLESLFNCPKK